MFRRDITFLGLFSCWLCGIIVTGMVSNRYILESSSARPLFPLKSNVKVRKESTENVLQWKVKFAAKFFDRNSFDDDIFPYVGIVRSKTMQECILVPPEPDRSFHWETFLTLHSKSVAKRGSPPKISEELLQEIGFIEMFRNHYPKSFIIDTDGTKENETLAVAVDKLHQLSPPPPCVSPHVRISR